jgi:hypothetical protein
VGVYAVQLAASLGAQATALDPRGQRLAGAVQRGADDPIDLGRRRRLQLPRPALGQELLAYQIGAALTLGDIAGEPAGQLVRVGHGELTEAEEPADLRPVPLDRPARPVVETQVTGVNADLLRDELNRLGRKVCTATREPAVPAVELQQQREPEPGVAMLRGGQVNLRGHQRSMLN